MSDQNLGSQQPRFGTGSDRDVQIDPHCGFPRFCQARRLALALSIDELRRALDASPAQAAAWVMRTVGLQAKSVRNPQVVRGHIAKLRPDQLHNLTWFLVATPIQSATDILKAHEAERSELLSLDDSLRGGCLARWAERWTVGIVRLCIEVVWDQGLLALEVRDEFLALLDDPAHLDSSVMPADVGGAEQDIGAAPPQDGRTAETFSGDRADIGRLLHRALDVALATSTTEAEAARQVAGIEWLIDLEPGLQQCWFGYGRLLAATQRAVPGRQPRGHGPRLAFQSGQLYGLAEGGDAAVVVAFADTSPDAVEAVLAETWPEPGAAEVLAPLLTAYLDRPREVARLLHMVRRPFEGWRSFVRQTHAAATTLIAQGCGADAEILLKAVEELLLRWAASRAEHAGEYMEDAKATMVLRASCRRRRSDFVGAARLLGGIETEALDAGWRVDTAMERAMAAAEISGIDQLCFPTKRERAHLVERLERARPYLGVVLDADPSHLEANALAGVLAYCAGHDADAGQHLGMLGDRLSASEEWRPLARAVSFSRGVTRLRQLEAGTDEGALHEMIVAIDAGYVPVEEELVSAAEALQAHDSPHVGEFLGRAIALAPRSVAVAALVMELARTGDRGAADIAERMAADHKRPVLERFELLDAALACAETAADAESADRLVGLVDDVVARANRPGLDERWAQTLATGETLRAVLEPAHADAIRIEVLRRAGRLDDARAIATALFYRAAAGSLASFDAAELLEVLRELGLTTAELDKLGRLVHDEPLEPKSGAVGPTIGSPGAPLLVLFVGGSEFHEQHRGWLEAEIEERYAGDVKVEWYFSGWGNDWAKVAESIEASYRRGPGAVVLMTFVRTNFGRWVRRSVGEQGVPWVACTGHGRASMSRAIDRAVRVASGRGWAPSS